MMRPQRRQRNRAGRAGFSRYEFFFLCAILLAIVSLVLPAYEFMKRWQRLVMARGDLRSIVTSIQHYHAKYNIWPGQTARQAGDLHYGNRRSNSEVMNVLRDIDGAGNPAHAANTNHVVFLDIAPCADGLSGLNGHGEFLDPWGNQYHIVLDLDYDNVCAVSDTIYSRIQGQGVIAWSAGPDGKSDTEDDLRSWNWVLTRRGARPLF
jgi:hypothetical protein